MTILLVLIPLSLVLLIVAIGAFVWAVRKGQFDDLDTPALDVLHDDEPPSRVRRHEDRDDHAD
ncbi:cbb3-type cytochrome oxidase assembly protein CcoS [Aerosticca soli]|jgi:cbb3-type cytochrome oxidase maturation protein|uniref:Type cbb3 cytochrome oxidase biogenesis protein CcoS n=1 Tax=Aerosticca soli TaxID=2010829 RepID=A0A2Z6E2P5_9GAMM|nr:cbb3-type cytochrome oxidase assembly protein CcoS [Aerosticca soli]MDI3262722.1 cbb3-type cytochrome oxidase assembly protein CcoS [Fulvimonas sp.]BBD79346.1 type cbb3 cytochrome oxidase biogenesis protein CcoS [Aerosticca soli]